MHLLPLSSPEKESSPVILQRSLSVGEAPWEYWLVIPRLAALGSGKVSVMCLWKRLLLGSTVIMGLTAARFPCILATNSGGTGWACNPISSVTQALGHSI